MKTRDLDHCLDGAGLRIGVAVAEFNADVTEGLLSGALEYLESAGAEVAAVSRVGGSFELPIIARRLARLGCDAVVALGAVIEGETDHYEHVAHRASEGLMQVMLETDVPVTFGILTTRDEAAAVARSRPGPDNKGAEAAEAAIRVVRALQSASGARSRT